MAEVEYSALFERIEAWHVDGEGGFHSDRQLADQVLLLDGWTVTPDAEFEGGFRWSWGNFHSSETARPHPLHDLNAALGLVPFEHGFRLEQPSLKRPLKIEGWTESPVRVSAWIWGALPSAWADPLPFSAQGRSSSAPAAICAAFVKWKWMESARGR